MKYLGWKQAGFYGVQCSKCQEVLVGEDPVHLISNEDGTNEAKVLCTKCLKEAINV